MKDVAQLQTLERMLPAAASCMNDCYQYVSFLSEVVPDDILLQNQSNQLLWKQAIPLLIILKANICKWVGNIAPVHNSKSSVKKSAVITTDILNSTLPRSESWVYGKIARAVTKDLVVPPHKTGYNPSFGCQCSHSVGTARPQSEQKWK